MLKNVGNGHVIVDYADYSFCWGVNKQLEPYSYPCVKPPPFLVRCLACRAVVGRTICYCAVVFSETKWVFSFLTLSFRKSWQLGDSVDQIIGRELEEG